MKDNRQKEQLFRSIREALIERNDPDTQAETSSGRLSSSPAEVSSAAVNNQSDDGDLCVTFTKNFTSAGGTLHYCYNESDIGKHIFEIQRQHGNVTIGCASENLYGFMGHLKIDNLEPISSVTCSTLGATLCEALIAGQGSIVISSNLGLGTTMTALPEATIVLAFTSQVVANWEVANERIKQLYPQYPDQIMVAHPASYACRKGLQKIYIILIEDETI